MSAVMNPSSVSRHGNLSERALLEILRPIILARTGTNERLTKGDALLEKRELDDVVVVAGREPVESEHGGAKASTVTTMTHRSKIVHDS